ncbi:hypothetical protein [Cutibacterium sp. V947]|uniref:hypothetical protein n=1 Tax=Cutibacterium sp. V947 TaxID=3446480 RepID=UPI003EDF344B
MILEVRSGNRSRQIGHHGLHPSSVEPLADGWAMGSQLGQAVVPASRQTISKVAHRVA